MRGARAWIALLPSRSPYLAATAASPRESRRSGTRAALPAAHPRVNRVVLGVYSSRTRVEYWASGRPWSFLQSFIFIFDPRSCDLGSDLKRMLQSGSAVYGPRYAFIMPGFYMQHVRTSFLGCYSIMSNDSRFLAWQRLFWDHASTCHATMPAVA